jgi:spore protease
MAAAKNRTDLALETREMLAGDGGDEIDGVTVEVEEDEDKGIVVTWVRIVNENGSRAMGRPVGNYVTIESQSMRRNDIDAHEEVAKVLARKLGKLKPLKQDAVALVVGLGNWQVTPDALGPKVCAKLLITRHISEDAIPDELVGKVRPVSALAPGVRGITGIETGEIIKGVVERIKPDVVIAIDALAARSSGRINATVQMTDTGVSPGAGMGNKRMMLNEETLGVPVVGLGVPTVVDAATLVNDVMDAVLTTMSREFPKGQSFYNMLTELQEEDKYSLIRGILPENMFVTPKDIDAVINRLANIIANALNMALHPGIDASDINRYMS